MILLTTDQIFEFIHKISNYKSDLRSFLAEKNNSNFFLASIYILFQQKEKKLAHQKEKKEKKLCKKKI